MRITAQQVCNACGGILLGGNPDTEISSVSTDSRQIRSGALFVPIKGERADGHTYIPATLAAGAAAVLTQENVCTDETHAFIYVPDTQKALQSLAAWYRSKFSFPLVGITGSVGKTTTKEMVALALSAQYNTMRTEGNFNSQIGLPLTMFRLSDAYEAAVIEMGMSDFGEMARLSKIARPQMAVITNIGVSHIGQLHSQENIVKEKLHITDGFGPENVLFINGDDPLLRTLVHKLPFPVVTFGTSRDCDYYAEQIEQSADGTRFMLCSKTNRFPVVIPIPGIHNVGNALAAVAVAEKLGISPQKAAEKLAGYRPLAMRQQFYYANGLTILDDTYNASPDSVKSCVDVLCAFETSGRKVAVLADMLELGDFSEKAHFDVGAYCARAGVDLVVTVGPESCRTACGARENGTESCEFSNNEEAISFLRSFLHSGDAVIVKGSRGMHTDEIVRSLLQNSEN